MYAASAWNKNTSISDSAIDEDEAYDEEALPVKTGGTGVKTSTFYDIVYSIPYQVPVLYIRPELVTLPADLTKLYELLVPSSYATQLQAVGAMGALSITDHPITGSPSYFVHPCRTREAMERIMGLGPASPERYLMLWIGLIGCSVHLAVPIELAQLMHRHC